jgi:HK97 family phage prohead protease
VFDRVDRGGDVVRKGAFAESLTRNPEVPLLLQHQAGRVIGTVEHLSEDSRGLRVIGWVEGRVADLVGSGLSFGYRVREARDAGGARELLALDLVEVSLVPQPMQRLARVHAVEAG